MLRKSRSQNRNLMKTKELSDSQNAKVTVQYIQPPQIYQKTENEDLEIENVEYLEDNAHVEEYIEDTVEKEDNFYPNAIHCLLDLYKNKYHGMMAEVATSNQAQLWHAIAKDMQESFFEFNENQIQLKYALLREQYFNLQTKEDIENFDYFEQLHEIYKDKTIEKILSGYNHIKTNSPCYKEELFLQSEQLEINEGQMHNFKSEEIVHKEHEFIDMVEKELQAMDGGVQINDCKENATSDRQENNDGISPKKRILSTFDHQPPNKTVRMDSESRREPGETSKSNGRIEKNASESNSGFSLYLYNQEQERRHREKMSLIQRSLEIQERALEQQQQLLRELIKRASS